MTTVDVKGLGEDQDEHRSLRTIMLCYDK